jgi:hypothetical protein
MGYLYLLFGFQPKLPAHLLGEGERVLIAYSDDADHSFRFDGDHYSE